MEDTVCDDITFSHEEQSLFNVFSSDFVTRTVTDYKRELLAFKSFINEKTKAEVSLLEASFDNAIHYIESLDKSSSTKQRIYYQLLGFYNFLVDADAIEINPFWKVKKPPASKQVKKERIPTFEEIEKLFHILSSDFSIRDLALVSFIATTGLRINTILNAKWSDFLIDDSGNIGFRIKRGEDIRYVRVLSSVWDMLNRYREEYLKVDSSYLKEDFYVFVTALKDYREFSHGVKALTQATARNILVAACRKANIPLFTPKDLRHTHAIFALKLGASAEEVKDQLGWSDPSLVYRYNGVIEQIQKPANVYTEQFFDKIIKN